MRLFDIDVYKVENRQGIVGQILRLILGGIKSFVGHISVGNPDGSDVPPLQSYPIEKDLQEIFIKAGAALECQVQDDSNTVRGSFRIMTAVIVMTTGIFYRNLPPLVTPRKPVQLGYTGSCQNLPDK